MQRTKEKEREERTEHRNNTKKQHLSSKVLYISKRNVDPHTPMLRAKRKRKNNQTNRTKQTEQTKKKRTIHKKNDRYR